MESLINYYYNINALNIQLKDDYYLVQSDNNLFLLCELQEKPEELMKIIDILNGTNIKYHLLVLTKDNNLYVTYNEKNYCLFKVRFKPKKKNSLLTFSNVKVEGLCNWNEAWSKRIDYYETQVEEVITEPSVKYALQYYIGLTEISIYFHNVLKEKYSNNDLRYSLSHKKINCPVSGIDYYNPANLIIDVEIRDLAEYFKSAYFNEILTESELLSLIDNVKFNDAMANYLFLRLLYPSYFFNLYDEYIETKRIDNKMILYIKKSKDYESLLTKVYSRLKINNNILIHLWFFKFQH